MQPDNPMPAPPPAPMPAAGPAPQAPPPPPSKFDFIVNNNPMAKRPSMSTGGSFKKRLFIVAGGAIVLIIIAMVLVSFLSSSGKKSTQIILDLAQEQQEIARIAGVGVLKSQDPNTKNLAITIQFSIQTSQKETLSLLAGKGHKLKPKDLGLKKNSKTDDLLTLAGQNNNFDTVFEQTIYNQLIVYRTSLLSASKSSTSKTEKELLQNSFNTANVLIGKHTAT